MNFNGKPSYNIILYFGIRPHRYREDSADFLVEKTITSKERLSYTALIKVLVNQKYGEFLADMAKSPF